MLSLRLGRELTSVKLCQECPWPPGSPGGEGIWGTLLPSEDQSGPVQSWEGLPMLGVEWELLTPGGYKQPARFTGEVGRVGTGAAASVGARQPACPSSLWVNPDDQIL